MSDIDIKMLLEEKIRKLKREELNAMLIDEYVYARGIARCIYELESIYAQIKE